MKCILHVTDKNALPAEYLAGFEFFNERLYFEAHEVWEKIWLRSQGTDRIFYQGLIQAAAALLKLQEGDKMKAAQSLCRLALQKFSEVPDLYLGLNVRKFELELKKEFHF